MKIPLRLPCIPLFLFGFLSPVTGADWPHWLGPNGDSVWDEEGLVRTIPEGGLKVKWEHPVGLGYGGPAMANGKVYVMDYQRTSGEITNNASWRDELTGTERVICLDAATGKEIWVFEYERAYQLSFPGGPRCTPTVADGKVYTLGAEGNLHCLNAESGEVIWKKSFADDYGAEAPIWGHSAHPLVYGDTLYCVVGGKGSVVVAFDKNTGKERWRALSASSQGYCGPTIINRGGVDQLIVWHPEALNGMNPETGEVYWSAELKPSYGMSITAPRVQGSRLFVSGQGAAGALFELDRDEPVVEMLWRGTPRNAIYTSTNTPVFTEDAIYGVDIDTSALTAVDPDDGSRLWQTTKPVLAESTGRDRHGGAYLVRLGESDTFYIVSESGDFIIAELTPREYREIGRTHVIDPTNNVSGRMVVWSHPAFAHKTMFARNDATIIAVDLARDSY